MEKSAKIVATVGPSSESESMISKLIDAGVDIFRLNAKHGTIEWHTSLIERIRTISLKKRKSIGILLDLQGPEIRIGKFENGKILLKANENVTITDSKDIGSEGIIVMKDIKVFQALKPGQQFLMDDGAISFKFIAYKKHKVIALVIKGGVLGNNKSVNFPNIDLNNPVLTDLDKKYIELGIKNEIEFFALSFVRNGKDVQSLRTILNSKNALAHIVSKIEVPHAVENIDEIIAASDAIMIGRGDLGVEIELPLVPLVQKEIIRKCRAAGKPVITATQMLESMISSPSPTRAEVSDVANAILDGTDAVMLSAESASGKYPIEAVAMMRSIDATIIKEGAQSFRLAHQTPHSTTEAISQAVDALSAHPLDFAAIVLLTETGRTARSIAKFRPGQPIFAVTTNKICANQLAMVWGITPVCIDIKLKDASSVFRQILSELVRLKYIKKGKKIVCVSGSIIGKEDLTNTVSIFDA